MKTLKVRIKDKHIKLLNKMACDVNFVWNYTNDLRYTHLKRTGKFFSAYDLSKYTAGSSNELRINARTICMVTHEVANKAKQFKKAKLAWRVSNPKSSKRSLGWIPFDKQNAKIQNSCIKYNGTIFNIWDSYGIDNYSFRSGCFVEDSRGRWYACLVVDTVKEETKGKGSIGIDLGLKDFATLSSGEKIDAQRIYRNFEVKLAVAQRANKKQRVRAIHAKIANKRKDFHHKLSNRLVKENAAIFVGDVNAANLAKTKLAKSVLDAGWSAFRTMLKYKCENAGVLFDEINEAFSTQTCSCCGSRQDSPKGRAGLGIRVWTCTECGTNHDRDVNAAKNILALAHERLAEGSAYALV